MKFPLLVLIPLLLPILSFPHSQEKWRRLTTEDGLSSNVVLDILYAKNGNIWIGTDQGLDRYNGLFEESSLPFLSLDGSFNSIFELSTGQVLAREIVPINITEGNTANIYFFDGRKWDKPDFFNGNDITVSDLPEFAVESDGQIWIATASGIVGFDGDKWQLYDPDVSPVDWLVKTPDGRLWSKSWLGESGDWKKGLASFDGRKWNLEFDTDNSLLDQANTKTVLATSNGMILLGTDQGLFQYDPVLNAIIDLKLPRVNIKLMHESPDRSLWVGTDQGLFRLGSGKWQQVIDGQVINTIGQTKKGILWVGTSNGLYQFHSGEWISVLKAPVNCFTELTDDTLLAGGNDGLRVKPSADETVAMQTELAGELVGTLVLASDGKLWCRSTAGILSYDGLKWTNHGGPPEMDWDNRYIRRYPHLSNIYEGGNGTIWFNGSGSSSGRTGILSFRDGIGKNTSIGHIKSS